MPRFTHVQIIMAAQIVHLAVNFLRCQDPSTHHCCSPFLFTCCWAVFFYYYYSIHSGLCVLNKWKNKTGPQLYDKFLWPVMAVSLKKRFSFPHDTQLVCGVLLLWRISPYWEFLPVFIRWCVSTSVFFFFFLSMQHTTWLFWFILQSWV